MREKEKTVIKVSMHPVIMVPLYLACLGIVYLTYLDISLSRYAICLVVFTVGLRLSYITYDTDSKILKRRLCGFPITCDMAVCDAIPVYQNDYLVRIDIYENGKKRTGVPVFREYRNRAQLIEAIFEVADDKNNSQT